MNKAMRKAKGWLDLTMVVVGIAVAIVVGFLLLTPPGWIVLGWLLLGMPTL